MNVLINKKTKVELLAYKRRTGQSISNFLFWIIVKWKETDPKIDYGDRIKLKKANTIGMHLNLWTCDTYVKKILKEYDLRSWQLIEIVWSWWKNKEKEKK